MQRYCFIGAAALVVGTVVAAGLGAQERLPSSPAASETVPFPFFGGSVGISIPFGGLADSHSAGFNFAGVVEYRVPTDAVGLRGELGYEHFDAKANVAGSPINAVAVTLNALYYVPGYAYRPYVIGGMGVYHVYQSNRPGLNGGAGIDIPLPGAAAFFEARLHWALTDGTSYVTLPISFGVIF